MESYLFISKTGHFMQFIPITKQKARIVDNRWLSEPLKISLSVPSFVRRYPLRSSSFSINICCGDPHLLAHTRPILRLSTERHLCEWEKDCRHSDPSPYPGRGDQSYHCRRWYQYQSNWFRPYPTQSHFNGADYQPIIRRWSDSSWIGREIDELYGLITNQECNTIEKQYFQHFYRYLSLGNYKIGGQEMRGTIVGLSPYGQLLVQGEDGTLFTCNYKEVIFLPPHSTTEAWKNRSGQF